MLVHTDMIGHPILGDWRYGKNNKNKEGLKLIAHRLKLKDPITNKKVRAELPEDLKLF